MGRSYAGILGPLAFFTEIFRGLMQAGGTESTVTAAIVALFAFAAIGFVLGELAAWIVDDSVRSRLAAEIAAAKPAASAAKVAASAAKPATLATAAAPNTVKPNNVVKPNPPPVKPNPPKPAAPAPAKAKAAA